MGQVSCVESIKPEMGSIELPDLKILASHPIQYQVPLFRSLVEAGLEIKVGYYHQGTAGRVGHDAEFGIDIEWDVDLLSGYPYHVFLDQPATFGIAEQVKLTPGLIVWTLRDHKTPLLLIGWFAHVIWLVWLLRIIFRAPVMMFGDTNLASFSSTPKPRWRVTLLHWLLQHTQICLFVGERNKAFFASMGVPDTRLIYTPTSIDNAYFSQQALQQKPRRGELCQQYGLDPVLPTFLFAGKLIPKKRPLELLEGYLAAGLADRVQLLYVGEGQLRSQLEARIRAAGASHVHLIGFLNYTQMPLAYVLGEVLCLISEATETWGLVVNEALACGRPVIVSETVGCAPDLVGPENGWIVPLDDHKALTQTLIAAYERRGEWPVMGQSGQAKVARHTFAIMAADVKLALEKVK